MENASKALIIAGAILLSILIIGLGIFIFGQARNSLNSTNLSEYEIQVFNSKIENYFQNKKLENTGESENYNINYYVAEGNLGKSIIDCIRNYNISQNDSSLAIRIYKVADQQNGAGIVSINKENYKNSSLYEKVKNYLMDGKTYRYALYYYKNGRIAEFTIWTK